MGLISKAFSDIITFSRSSNATRIGPDGTVQFAPHNLATYSEQFDNAAWSKLNTTVTANAVASPNGTVTADKIVETAVTAAFLVYQTGVASGGTYTLSIYAKAAERSKFALEFASVGYEAVFDLSAGTVYSTTSSTATITSMGNGWYRCSATAAIASSSTVAIGIRDASGSRSYAGTAGSGIYGWGAQLSVGSIAGDYTTTTSAAVYGPRFDYDPVTLAAKGLLIEEQRTNLQRYSNIDYANWNSLRADVVDNQITSPFGTTTAPKVNCNATGAGMNVSGLGCTISSGATITASVYLKKGYDNFALVIVADGTTSNGVRQYVNINTGVLGSSSTFGTGWAKVGATISNAGNGWYRVTFTVSTTGTSAAFLIYPSAPADGDTSCTSGVTFGYPWGAQVEAGEFATSYIPTIASTVTRSADVASVNTLSPWYNATEGTLFVQADVFAAYDIADLAELGDGGYNNRSFVFTAASGNVAFAVDVSGTRQAALSGGFVANTPFKISAAYKANDFAASINGATATTDTSGTVPTVSALYLGRQAGGGGNLNGHLRRVAYFPRRLTNAELQALTA